LSIFRYSTSSSLRRCSEFSAAAYSTVKQAEVSHVPPRNNRHESFQVGVSFVMNSHIP
jgi:hypothetical protein